MKKILNLLYYDDPSKYGNFGDELNKIIVEKLINKDKYELVYNKNDNDLNLICIGSYIQMAIENTYIFGSGVRTPDNKENGHHYINLNVCAVRGPLSKKFLENRDIHVPEIYGDPALLLPKFYTPVIDENLKNMIGVIPHKTNYDKYVNNLDNSKFFLINPMDYWENVINYMCSCKSVISSSLHGLICADSYNIPNLWLNEYALSEGEFKFHDYFDSQKREHIQIKSLDEYDEKLLYFKGNIINLEELLNSFPFY